MAALPRRLLLAALTLALAPAVVRADQLGSSYSTCPAAVAGSPAAAWAAAASLDYPFGTKPGAVPTELDSTVADACACATACTSQAGCAVWTFDSVSKICALKTLGPNTAGWTTIFAATPDNILAGDFPRPIVNGQLDGPTQFLARFPALASDACVANCNALPSCAYVNWNSVSNECFLKPATPAPATTVSGVLSLTGRWSAAVQRVIAQPSSSSTAATATPTATTSNANPATAGSSSSAPTAAPSKVPINNNSGNDSKAAGGSDGGGSGSNLPLIIGVVVGALAGLLVAVGFLFWRRKQAGKKDRPTSFSGPYHSGTPGAAPAASSPATVHNVSAKTTAPAAVGAAAAAAAAGAGAAAGPSRAHSADMHEELHLHSPQQQHPQFADQSYSSHYSGAPTPGGQYYDYAHQDPRYSGIPGSDPRYSAAASAAAAAPYVDPRYSSADPRYSSVTPPHDPRYSAQVPYDPRYSATSHGTDYRFSQLPTGSAAPPPGQTTYPHEQHMMNAKLSPEQQQQQQQQMHNQPRRQSAYADPHYPAAAAGSAASNAESDYPSHDGLDVLQHGQTLLPAYEDNGYKPALNDKSPR
ncbi:hypothetical protein BDZ88DRAFT_505382 [Geranomyces variabilis]|nr:hypothetical protein BDZ88DRAFT_505382 [Geranomyces variabilis]KAJ3131543.1 hypothetical protein HDU90_008210 [Geranomyces variabilis]